MNKKESAEEYVVDVKRLSCGNKVLENSIKSLFSIMREKICSIDPSDKSMTVPECVNAFDFPQDKTMQALRVKIEVNSTIIHIMDYVSGMKMINPVGEYCALYNDQEL